MKFYYYQGYWPSKKPQTKKLLKVIEAATITEADKEFFVQFGVEVALNQEYTVTIAPIEFVPSST